MKVSTLVVTVALSAVMGVLLIHAGLSSGLSFLFQPQVIVASVHGPPFGKYPSHTTLQQFAARAWLPRSEVQIGLGFCVITAISPLLATSWKLPTFLTAERRVGKRTKAVALALVVAGLAVFAFFAAYIALWNLIPPPHPLYKLFNDPKFPGGNWFGVPPAVSLSLAAIVAMVAWLKRGLLVSLKRVLTLVVSPPVFIYTLGLLLLKPSEMVWHVTNFLSLGVMPSGAGLELGFFPISVSPSLDNGIDLFSNWLVLMFSGFLTSVGLWGIIKKRRGITMVARDVHHLFGILGVSERLGLRWAWRVTRSRRA